MIIVKENKTPKREAGSNSQWDISWKDALGVFKAISKRNDITFFEVGPDRNPLGNQPILGLTIYGFDLVIQGRQTGYIVFGSQVKRVVREHFEKSGSETIRLLFSPYKELEIGWSN